MKPHCQIQDVLDLTEISRGLHHVMRSQRSWQGMGGGGMGGLKPEAADLYHHKSSGSRQRYYITVRSSRISCCPPEFPCLVPRISAKHFQTQSWNFIVGDVYLIHIIMLMKLPALYKSPLRPLSCYVAFT